MTQGILLQDILLTKEELVDLIKQVIIGTEVAVTKKQVPQIEKTSDFLTRKEAAKRLNLSLPTLAKYSRNGLLNSYRIGMKILYKEKEIERSLQAVTNQKFKA